jgi:hypothetical protein
MRSAKWLSIGFIATVGCVAVAALIILWRWHMPSSAVRAFGRVVADRPKVADADNAYLYAWGFIAAPGDSVERMAEQRVAWLRRQLEDPADRSDDPFEGAPSADTRRSASLKRLMKACGSELQARCAQAFDEWSGEIPAAGWDATKLTRYQALIAHRGWFETLPFFADSPLPPLADVLDGQKIYFGRVRQLADAGDAESVRRALQADLEFWREMQRSADILITKMIATAGIRHHFYFGNLVVRRLPPESISAAIPAAWSQPFSSDELSMLRALAGEVRFIQVESRRQTPGASYLEDEALSDPESVLDGWLNGIGQVVRPPQRYINKSAEAYMATAKAFAVPLDQYPRAQQELQSRFSASPDTPDATSYAMRVGSIEGMRRATLLTAQLRSRNVGSGEVPAELQSASLRQPFTNAPFDWDAAQSAVTYAGAEKRESRILRCFY